MIAASRPLLDVRDLCTPPDVGPPLVNVNLTLVRGAVTVLSGRVGSGKTTLLDALTGAVPVAKGEIRLRGERIDGLPGFRIARLGIGRSFHPPRPFRRLSVLDNMLVGSWRARPEARGRASELVELVGLADRAGMRADGLPPGAAKCLEVARALMPRPSVLLLDEPGVGASGAERERLSAVVRQFVAGGGAVLMAETALGLGRTLPSRVVVLDGGVTIAGEEVGGS